MVLLKGYSHEGFRFFSNYESRKGGELVSIRPLHPLYWLLVRGSQLFRLSIEMDILYVLEFAESTSFDTTFK